MSKFWSLAALIVGAAIILDLTTHPSGTSAAFTGVTGLESAAGNQLLGGTNTGGK